MNSALAELPLPVRLRTSLPLSDEELLRFCAAHDELRVERMADGELIVMSPAGSESSGKNNEITTDLTIWARADGRGKVFDSSAGFTLNDGSMLSPDAAWIAYPRWNALTREEQRRFAPICPDFVIELRSPSDVLSELEAKMERWIVNGAQLAWLIDPARRAVAIYRPDLPPQLLEDLDVLRGEGPVEGLLLPLTEIWK
jgi:Uma2 family endonuclease